MAVVQISKRDAYRIMFKDYPDVLNIDEMCDILGISTKTGYQLLLKQEQKENRRLCGHSDDRTWYNELAKVPNRFTAN